MNDTKIPTAPLTDMLDEIRAFAWAMFPPQDDVCTIIHFTKGFVL